MRKIPPLDLSYWLLLTSATIFGETGGDLLSMGLGVGYMLGTAIFLAFFFVALAAQSLPGATHPGFYWAIIITTSTTGTTISDMITRTFDLGYAAGSGVLALALALVFAVWRIGGHVLRNDGTMNPSTEALYWIGILVASTLGTCFGDFVVDESNLGFGGATVLLSALLATVALLQFVVKTQRELFYWAAIVVVHPIGATAGDYLTKPDGLNMGMTKSSVMLGLIFAAVSLLAGFISRRQQAAQAD